MDRPTSSDLLDAWEQASRQSLPERAMTLLSLACPERDRGELEGLSIGERDALLLILRERVFGSCVEAVFTCPGCREELEFEFSADSVRVGSIAEERVVARQVRAGDCELQVRVPNCADLMAIAGVTELEAARKLLISRCVLSVRTGGGRVDLGELPDSVVLAVEAEVQRVDPQSDIRLDLSCPGCGRSWREPFDVLGFFWNELKVWARRLLLEVDALASSYGWSESDILQMSATRRDIYLGMVR